MWAGSLKEKNLFSKYFHDLSKGNKSIYKKLFCFEKMNEKYDALRSGFVSISHFKINCEVNLQSWLK